MKALKMDPLGFILPPLCLIVITVSVLGSPYVTITKGKPGDDFNTLRNKAMEDYIAKCPSKTRCPSYASRELRCANRDLATPLHGTKCCEKNQYSKVCTLSCNSGYKPISPMDITCIADSKGNGMWSAPSYDCTELRCANSDLPTPSYGTKICDGNQYSRMCTLSCDSGYKPISQMNITCIAGSKGNGTWSGPSYNCTELRCDNSDLPTPSYGTKICDGNQYSVVCTLSCNSGYKPILPMNITCIADSKGNGTWSGPSYNCTELRCANSELLAPLHGTKFCNGNNQSSLCTLSCDSGYKPVFPNNITCIADSNGNKTWSAPSYNCTELRCANSDLATPFRGTKICDGSQRSVVCTLSCNSGYKPIPTSEITCIADSNGIETWSTTSYDCTVASCAQADFPIVANTTRVGCVSDDPAPYLSDCTLKCVQGTVPSQEPGLACSPDSLGLGLIEPNVSTVVCKGDWLVYKNIGTPYPEIISDDRFAANDGTASLARLHTSTGWVTSQKISWVTLNFSTSTQLSGILAQGRSIGYYRVIAYKVAYQTSISSDYQYVLNYDGNPQNFVHMAAATTVVLELFDNIVNATKVKIEPTGWVNDDYNAPLAMRFELLGSRLN